MGGGSTTQQAQTSTSTNTINPQELAMLQGNYQTAQNNASTLTPYTGQLTAGFTPAQTQAQGVLSGVATDPQYAANNTAATGAVNGVLGANSPTTVNAQAITPSTIANTDLSPYLNPYTSDVINNSITQNERARQIAQVADSQQATAAGAFGGSRSGVLAAGTNEAYDRNDQTNIAALNAANFTQAQAAAGTDAATTNAANEFNSNQNVNAQQSTIANTAAQQGLKLNAAGQLVSDNAAGLNTAATQGGILASVGDAQQSQAQTALTNAYNAYTQGQQLTVEQQQLLNSALGLIPNQQTVNSSGTGNSSTQSTPGLGGILSGFGGLLGGVGSLGSGGII